jgi:hypothetical protein
LLIAFTWHLLTWSKYFWWLDFRLNFGGRLGGFFGKKSFPDGILYISLVVADLPRLFLERLKNGDFLIFKSVLSFLAGMFYKEKLSLMNI